MRIHNAKILKLFSGKDCILERSLDPEEIGVTLEIIDYSGYSSIRDYHPIRIRLLGKDLEDLQRFLNKELS